MAKAKPEAGLIMRRMVLISTFCLPAVFVVPAWTAELRLDGAAIEAILTDHVFVGVHGQRKTEQIFQKGGATYYSVDGAQSQGRWDIRGDMYCSQWPPNDSWNCFEVIQDGLAIAFISASGKRFDVTRSD